MTHTVAERLKQTPHEEMRTIIIRFLTTTYPPAYMVTIVCDQAETGRILQGEYTDGAWRFELRVSQSDARITIDFWLNQEVRMEEPSIIIDPSVLEHTFTEKEVSFSGFTRRHSHYIERLVTEVTDFTRRAIISNVDSTRLYDVIVVGSGMGGGVLADQLSDRGLMVLVLEVGTVHQPTHVGNLPTGSTLRTSVAFENTEGSVLTRDVCLNLGGRSLYWSAVIPRMNPWDLAHWPDEIAYYLLRDGYTRAERLFRKRTEFNDFERVLRARIEERFSIYTALHLPRSYHQESSWITARVGHPDERPTGYFSTAALLLNSLSYPGMTGGENLTVNLNHLVTHLEVDGDRITGVVCQDLIDNCTRTYRARCVVLCAGATESPCIALRSRLRDESCLIGKGLTDHQSAELVFEIPRESPVISPQDTAKILMLPRTEIGNNNEFSCELALNWRFWDPHYEDDDLWLSRFPAGAPVMSTSSFSSRNGSMTAIG